MILGRGGGTRGRLSSAATLALGAALRVTALAVGAGGGCVGPPWLLGEPLDGKPAIPPTSRAVTVAEHRRTSSEARARGEKVVEIAELMALEGRGALSAAERRRLADLLEERVQDWIALERPLPLADDLRHIAALSPSRATALAARLGAAERAAGDRWLALGESARAEDAYRRAQKLGSGGLDFRLRAAGGVSPADLDAQAIVRAMTELPERALAPFAAQYLKRSDPDPRLVARAWTTARLYGPPALLTRIEALPMAATFREQGFPPVAGQVRIAPLAVPDAQPDAGAPSSPDTGSSLLQLDAGPPSWLDARPSSQPDARPSPALVEPSPDDWLLGGATLARALVPLAATFPRILEQNARSRAWADRLIAEDARAPDSLEVAASIDARAGRLGGATRKLGDLVFYSPDRAAAYGRAARVWEAVGQTRRACAAWDRAARFGAVDDPRWCALISCLRRDPAAGDAQATTAYVQRRAPALICARDGQASYARPPVPVDAGAGDAGTDGASGEGRGADGGGRDGGADGAGHDVAPVADLAPPMGRFGR